MNDKNRTSLLGQCRAAQDELLALRTLLESMSGTIARANDHIFQGKDAGSCPLPIGTSDIVSRAVRLHAEAIRLDTLISVAYENEKRS